MSRIILCGSPCSHTHTHTHDRGRYVEDMDIEDAIHTAILTLKEGFEGEMTDENIEIGVCRDDGAFEVLSDAEIRDYLEAV